jgi:DNA adenine methylase
LTSKKPPSLIKWTGSKRSQANVIASIFPKANTYYELFLGGGAVLYNATFSYNNLVANDLYEPLISLWKSIQKDPYGVYSTYEKQWRLLQEDFPEYYYIVRDRFNNKPNGDDLLFLSRTCTNGIIRFNKSGKFNNSLHVTRRGMHPKRFKNILYEWGKRLSDVEFRNSDYFEFLDTISANDFVYLDPPYYNSKNRYISNLDYEKFINFLYSLNRKGAKWALSFDGSRGDSSYLVSLGNDLYKQHLLIECGHSSVKKVLSSSNVMVQESLYLNYN